MDAKERTQILQQLDGILAGKYIYVLRWYDPAQRVVFLNKFAMPKGSFSRVGNYNGTLAPGIPQLWWVDPQKARQFERAQRDRSVKLDTAPVDDHYWEEFGKTAP